MLCKVRLGVRTLMDLPNYIQQVGSGRQIILPKGFVEEGDYVVLDEEEGQFVVIKKIKKVVANER